MAKHALDAGKHVLCEKPITTTSADARSLVGAAARTGLRNCLCHNLRYYPMVQHMRRLRESGELGEVLVVQGTYSQDWLLFDTDWNWRIEETAGGPLRCLADIGTHWFDMVQHVTGEQVTSLCADLQTYHTSRKRPKGSVETFGGKFAQPDQYDEVPVTTDDFGAVIFRLGGRGRGAMTASQVSAGNKNRLSIEVYGTRGSVAWNQERPDELWMGQRNEPNRILIKDPSLLQPAAQSYADLPGGHSEGYDDTFKQVFRRFYGSIDDPSLAAEYPQFADGLRQMQILDAVMKSHKSRAWVEVGK
jgi:predicted dehydrogenase